MHLWETPYEKLNVSRAGLEPATTGLKGHCSTIELPTQLVNLGFSLSESRFSVVPHTLSGMRDLFCLNQVLFFKNALT